MKFDRRLTDEIYTSDTVRLGKNAFQAMQETIYHNGGVGTITGYYDAELSILSVSDVIALKRNGEVSVHYVDSIGFKDLQGFLDKQPERPSVLMNLKEKCDAPECNPTVCRKVRAEHEL